MIHETGDGYGILTNIQQRNIHSLILFCVLCVLVFNTTNTQRAVSYERWWKTFCRNRTNRKWDGLLIQAKTHRRTQARAQRYLNTYLTLLSSVFLSQLHTRTHKHSCTKAAGWVVATQVRLTVMCVLEWDDDAPPKDLKRNMMKLPCKCYVSAHRHVCVEECAALLHPLIFIPILLAGTTNTGGYASVALRNMTQVCSCAVH